MEHLIENQPVLVMVTCFLAIFLLCLGLVQVVRERTARRDMLRKIRAAAGIEAEGAENTHAAENEPAGPGGLFRAFSRIGAVAVTDKGVSYSEGRVKFLNAGIRNLGAPSAFWGAKIILMAALPGMFAASHLLYFNRLDFHWVLTGFVATGLLGFYLPDLWLSQKRDQRRDRIRKALPDALDLLVVCVEAGMGLDSALNRVALEIRGTTPELGDELNLTILELRAGKQRPDALRNLSLRTGLEEVHSLTTLLVQTDKFGTSLAQALRVYSDSFRTQRYQRAEELAAKLPVKLVLPVVCFIFPSLFVVILGPAAITIYNNIFKVIE